MRSRTSLFSGSASNNNQQSHHLISWGFFSLPFWFSSRPGSCAGEGSAAAYKSSTTFPDETLTFIKSYPLMDESVPSVNDRPYFTRTTSRWGWGEGEEGEEEEE